MVRDGITFGDCSQNPKELSIIKLSSFDETNGDRAYLRTSAAASNTLAVLTAELMTECEATIKGLKISMSEFEFVSQLLGLLNGSASCSKSSNPLSANKGSSLSPPVVMK